MYALRVSRGVQNFRVPHRRSSAGQGHIFCNRFPLRTGWRSVLMATQVPREAAAALSSSVHAGGAEAAVPVSEASASLVLQSFSNRVESGSIITSAVVESNVQIRQDAGGATAVAEPGAAAAGEEQKDSIFFAKDSEGLATAASNRAVSDANSSTGDSSNSERRSIIDGRKEQKERLSARGTSLALTLVTCSAQERMQRLLEMKKALDRFREDDVAENSIVRSASAAADDGKRQTTRGGHVSSDCAADDVRRMRPAHTQDVLEVFAVLDHVNMNREILSKTRIGVSVGKLRSHPNPQVRSCASELISKWKASIGPAPASAAADAQSSGAVSAAAAGDACAGAAAITRSSPAASSNAHSGVSGSPSPDKNYDDFVAAPNLNSSSETGRAASTATTQRDTKSAAEAHNGGGDGEKRGGGVKGTMSPAHASCGEFPGPLTGDSVRDRARIFLWKALLDGMQQQQPWSRTGGSAGGTAAGVARGGETAAEVAAQVEEALWGEYCVRKRSTKEYTAQLKTLKWNFADPKNPDLNLKVLCGVFTPEQLAKMTSAELASDEKKRLREQQKKESMEACQSDWEMKKLMQGAGADGQFPCFKCRTTKTVYFQMQTRSSDEPMTTFVTCLECGNRWKF